MYKNILVAVDGSEHALKAARVAGEFARQMQAELRLVTVYEPVPTYLGEPNLQHALDERFALAQQVIDGALQEIGEIPGELKTDVLEGPAAEAILAVIEARNNDLVIMGTRGLGRLTGLLLGSQSQKVVAHAPCPVLLVR
ncbi:MAG: universal stress protein [Chloroflexi bacterium RBG_16_57_11]|nr:MAG: universal stress protein [Chloroflexi bacterium RBG_16_57_11]